ncbi:transporter substrate-binding protein [Pseudomonas sp. CCM 7893]|uniref:Transporter substrate-binding protein n=1 Tax=Pseudomonas spelaei TaxID=1055469 RepID=A0A6I3WLR2_9PSED|nr:transporter substrate-binding protein [Pseudomonas spelaei]MUF08303.1 transporter substrate-binding protein [Pseudomonas spelaei]
MRRTIDVGILLSTNGTYRCIGRNALAGAAHAVAEINANVDYEFAVQVIHINPQGYLYRYSEGSVQLMQAGIRHIFGTTTSASRKEIIPDLEQNGGLLWYACPYEGFESSENVLYLGGCPNQTLIPLLRYALQAFGSCAALIGSNYIWGWESNRVAREVLEVAGGTVLLEKYVSLGTARFSELIQTLITEKPAFVLNNLVGESSYVFLQQLDIACHAIGLNLPVLSCNLTEAELPELGAMRSLRLLSCGPFFEDVDRTFSQRQRRLHGPHPLSHFYTGMYVALHLFAKALSRCGSEDPARICNYLYEHPQNTVLGKLNISARNNHCSQPCHIAELREGRFVILRSEACSLPADPYLTATDLSKVHHLGAHAPAPRLRIVK